MIKHNLATSAKTVRIYMDSKHALYLCKTSLEFEAISHTRLRARDRYTPRTLIGGKGGAGPSSLLHTVLEGPPMEYVNAR
jgi:hypothetical protein